MYYGKAAQWLYLCHSATLGEKELDFVFETLVTETATRAESIQKYTQTIFHLDFRTRLSPDKKTDKSVDKDFEDLNHLCCHWIMS